MRSSANLVHDLFQYAGGVHTTHLIISLPIIQHIQHDIHARSIGHRAVYDPARSTRRLFIPFARNQLPVSSMPAVRSMINDSHSHVTLFYSTPNSFPRT